MYAAIDFVSNGHRFPLTFPVVFLECRFMFISAMLRIPRINRLGQRVKAHGSAATDIGRNAVVVREGDGDGDGNGDGTR